MNPPLPIVRFLAAIAVALGVGASPAALGQEYLWTTIAGSIGGPGMSDGVGAGARLNYPTSLALASDGSFYLADRYNHSVRRLTPEGVVTTVAGNADVPGDADGTGRAATFRGLSGIAINADGLIFIADTENQTIRTMTPGGVVTTLAGRAGVLGSTDGALSEARFRYPSGLAFDQAGNLFVADSGNHTIRKITRDGRVSTLAGRAGEYGHVNGTGGDARLNSPFGIVVAPDGTLYVSEDSNIIRRVSQTGAVSDVAGSWEFDGGADGVGIEARFDTPRGLVMDANGDLIVADHSNYALRRVTTAGVVTTIAGALGQSGYRDGPAAEARFNAPWGLALDAQGALYIAEYWNMTVRRLDLSGDVVTVAGAPLASGRTDGVGTAARFDYPQATAVDAAGTVFVADSYNNSIRKIARDGTVTTIVGLSAGFWSPAGIVVAPDGVLYVADRGNEVIQRVAQDGTVTVWAGQKGRSGSTDGARTSARFSGPEGMEIDAAGNIYVADSNNFTIRKITPQGTVSTVAGRAGEHGSADGPGAQARFFDVSDVALDAAGNLYVSDTSNHIVRKITADGMVSTIAGRAGQEGLVDGPAMEARFSRVQGVAVDRTGNVFVSERNTGSLIRKITPEGMVSTVGGKVGLEWVMTGDGVGSQGRFNHAWGLSTGPDGTLYVADSAHHRIVTGVPYAPEIVVFDAADESGTELSNGQSTPVDFGNARLGVPVVRAFRVANTGVLPLVVESVTVPAGYRVLDAPAWPAEVAPRGALTISVQLEAGALGVSAGSIQLDSNDLDEATFNFPVTGRVVAPEIVVRQGTGSGAPELVNGQESPVDIGGTIQGTPAPREFVIGNVGDVDLRVDAVSLPGGYETTGLPATPFAVAPGALVRFHIVLTTLAVGTHAGPVRILNDDPDEPEFHFPITASVFIPPPVVAVVQATTALNRQTGLREQTVRVVNDTTATVPAYALVIRGLPEGVAVHNATEKRADESFVLLVRQSLTPRSTVDVVVEYFSANRLPVAMNPSLTVEVVLDPPDDAAGDGSGTFTIDRIVRLETGDFLIEFPSVIGRTYQIQYSADGIGWKESPVPLTATATRTQWIDRGPPRTDQPPSAVAARWYRVKEAAP